MKRTFTIIIAIVIIFALGVPTLRYLLGYWYVESENRNFRKMRAEVVVDCETMPFHCAVKKDSMKMFDEHIARGEDIETVNLSGQSALFWTVRGSEVTSINSPSLRMDPEKRSRFIDKLLVAGANVQTKDIREKSLLHVALAGDLQTVKKLVTSGADVNQRSNERYYYLDEKPLREWVYPLYVAVSYNDVEKVRYLIEKGASINQESMPFSTATGFETALHMSVRRGNLEITTLLLEAGADPNKLNHIEQTPLFMSASNGDIAITKQLLRYGVNKELTDAQGHTALEHARLYKNTSQESERLLGQ
tara:strand:- start:7472 stop:8386 length:915 start_codon:yes stop_codon:yes gene_type:complete